MSGAWSLITVLPIPILLMACTSSTHDPAAAGVATVVHVLDGDTLDVQVGGNTERVRLIGIDTPEIAHPAMGTRPANAAECFGPEAQAFTERMLPEGTRVRLVRDIVARDDYGRLLAYVYVEPKPIFLNYELARQGFATPLTIAPNDSFADQIVAAATTAEHDAAGLWSACRVQQ